MRAAGDVVLLDLLKLSDEALDDLFLTDKLVQRRAPGACLSTK